MLDPIDRQTETELRDLVDPAELERHVDAFVGLDRVSGTDDEWDASEYVVETLESYGVDATLHEFEGYVSVPESGSVTVTTPTHHEITDAITTSFSASTPTSGLVGELVHVPEVTPEALAGRDVAGKIAFTTGLPTPEPIGILEEAGVEGVVFQSINPDELHEMIVTPVWGTPGVDEVDEIPNLPVVEVSHDAGEWLAGRLDEGPVEATLTTRVTTELTTLPCAVGRIDGTESDQYFVVGNHVDSWYEGITDNATAMVSTLELARLFADAEPKRGLVFGFWPAHSTGRYAGSAWWADEHYTDLRENGVGYLHIDLNGLKGADGLWFQHMAELAEEHRDAMEVATDMPLREAENSWLGGSRRPARNSDQSFWGAGVSSLLSGARLEPESEEGGPIGGGWWWHTPEDTRDKVDIDVLVEETRLYTTIASRICNSPVLPHDFTATVDDITETLDAVADAAEGEVDFTGLQEQATDLRERIERVNAVIDERAGDDADLAVAAAALQKEFANRLNPALYMDRPAYEHDPALSHALLPSLRIAEELPNRTGRDRRFAEASVQRGKNRLAESMREAARAADRFLDASDQTA
ncbi:M28 family peptidase [Halococcus sp. IIIV-5B]|uniref:M28 family peptidase n=1 Tax=Halococcus sp. IIIV-5B TaxID=2321230 RepID=UPI000E7725C0|nr:M28 family peptidase [Halococcus sp. IIIV-5B]RJT07871.1 M28 family peptidase [Halococcus sp. IIIV-5B]